jgi:hypothetical protein
MAEEKRHLDKEITAILEKESIPEPERVMREFDFLTISDETTNLEKELARKVKERLATYVHLLEDLIQPDNGLSSLNECSFYSEEEHKQIIAIYRRLMQMVRTFTEHDLTGSDFSRYVKEALLLWNGEREGLLTIVKKLQKGWGSEEQLQMERGYFG